MRRKLGVTFVAMSMEIVFLIVQVSKLNNLEGFLETFWDQERLLRRGDERRPRLHDPLRLWLSISKVLIHISLPAAA